MVQDFAGPSVLYVVFTPRNPWSRLSTPTTCIIYLLFFNQFTPFPPILPSIVCIHFYILLYSIVSLFSGVYIYIYIGIIPFLISISPMYLFHVQVDGVESKEELMKQFDANGDGVLTKEEPLRCGYFGRHRWLENPPLSSMIVPAINGYKPPSLGFFSIATFDWRVNGKTMGQYIKIIRETHHRNAVHFDGENAGRSLYSRYPIFRQTQVYSFQSQLLYCQGEAGVREREVFLSVPIPAAIP